jgi:uncharacterized membrane protein
MNFLTSAGCVGIVFAPIIICQKIIIATGIATTNTNPLAIVPGDQTSVRNLFATIGECLKKMSI